MAAIAAGIAFGAFGGEYRSIDYWRLKREVRQEEELIRRLQVEVDSLAALADSLEHDSATVERVARERLGMVREGETLYRVVDSTEGGGEERE
ncbi:MAG: septum formation initiator family protein [Gemmatimonadales bacterium]